MLLGLTLVSVGALVSGFLVVLLLLCSSVLGCGLNLGLLQLGDFLKLLTMRGTEVGKGGGGGGLL
jgi:hypothetical protein